MRARAVLQDRADQVVGDGLHEHLAFDHLRGEGAQHIQAEGRFDVAEVVLDLPPAAIQRD